MMVMVGLLKERNNGKTFGRLQWNFWKSDGEDLKLEKDGEGVKVWVVS
jgi:hypothetical protein